MSIQADVIKQMKIADLITWFENWANPAGRKLG